jgi:beta-N-acetylhexosaminidase
MDELERLASSVLMIGFGGREPSALVRDWLEADALGGVILFRRNVGTIVEVAALGRALTSLREGVLVAVDQEGGRVARLGAPVVKLPPARRFGEIDDVALTERAAALLGRQLRAVGINVDFAPVLDVDTNPANPIIGDRAFGRSADAVIRHAGAFARGLASAGVIACGKHFPGHGDTDLDSHLALPRIGHDRARLASVELAPFRALAAELPTIMTAHVVFDAIEPKLPATLCRDVIEGVLRRELGFGGVIVSDDLEMRAVRDHWGVADAAVRAIEAGCDLLLVCEHEQNVVAARDALRDRARNDPAFEGRLREAEGRIEALRESLPHANDIDPARIDPEASVAMEREIASRHA